jgi:serine/threonine protein kinase
MPVAPGTRLGQYEVQDFIGQGAMGVVYRAYHPGLERTGAVKVMQAISPDPTTVARFRHEAQAIARLRHPNIVEVYDFGEFQGAPYMVVEYVPGGSLAGKMAAGKLDRATALRYLRGIAAGLDYAHAHGVVHRDVKPANVLLSSDDSPVLADFGLARLMEASSLKSMTGVTTGTPAYMAPEQVAGAHAGPPADRYSLATMAYEMLTGVIPFDGEGLMEVLYAQVQRYPEPPSARMAELGPDVDAVIMRGLAKDPALRWESCSAFVEALEDAIESAPVRQQAAATMVMAPPAAKTAPLVTRPLVHVAPPPSPASTSKSGLRRRIDRRLVAALALLLVLISFGVCAIVAQATTLTVNPSQAARGDYVRVTAAHVPAGQAGEIQLHSVVHTFAFRADGKGQVDMEMPVPLDAELGDHVVKICWDNACHGDAPLKVVEGVAVTLPTPSGGPTSSPSPSPKPSGTPSHGSTPPATSTPGSTPRSTPTATPTSAPKPSPTPTKPPPSPSTNPCPGNSNALQLSPSSQNIRLSGGNATVSGSNFKPSSSVLLTYYALSGTAYRTWSVTASCSGSFTVTFATKPTLLPRTDTITACDAVKGCVSATIKITL